jgi:AsmA protein
MNAPLTLLAGGDSPLQLSVQAAPANLSFEGIARQFDGMQIEGATTLRIPSVSRFAQWTGGLTETALIGAATIAGQVSWAAATLNLSQATIDLDGNAGEGALTASIVDGRPSLQGTLDFARFDLTPQANAIAAAIDAGGAWQRDPIRLPLFTTANVDLRLSAGSAVVGTTEVGPLAASLLVNDGSMRAEIGEAHLGAGLLEASVVAGVKDGVLSGSASLKGDELPADALARLLGVTGVSGTIETALDLTGSGGTWGDIVASLAGSGSFSLVEGRIEGVDITTLPQAIADPSAADAGSLSGGATGIGLATANIAVAGGAVSTDDLRVEGQGYGLDLAGRVALPTADVEGRGVLTLLGDTPSEVPFLVNGQWPALRVHPDLGGTLPREDGGGTEPAQPTDG